MNGVVFFESMCSRADVSLEILQAPAPVIVELDAMLFEQALINIIKNSIEAITPEGNGKITIETHASPEKLLTVTDNGSGISDEAASHLFTPLLFNQTRRPGAWADINIRCTHPTRLPLQYPDLRERPADTFQHNISINLHSSLTLLYYTVKLLTEGIC